jgi:LuxR family transcriptional regulator, maltose regulon positive regulatory protein
MAHELTLVCTPAGFGKTTLLADWARRDPRPVAWLSLDEGDNDPARFWRHVAAALDAARSGIADRIAPLLQGLQPASVEALAATLVNELAELTEEAVRVLDDYHLLQAPPVHASVEFLLAHLPPRCGWWWPAAPTPPAAGTVARSRAAGRAAPARPALHPHRGRRAAARRGRARPAGGGRRGAGRPDRRLGGRAPAGGPVAAGPWRRHRLREGFSGSHRYVLDYLTEEVLAREPQPLRAFLLETSVLERLCGPLCAAVTGRADSQQLLEQVERANLFLVPLDEVRGWWRYHHLFAELLRARLQQQQPERVAGLHRAAATWCERHGLVDDAIRHALTARGWRASTSSSPGAAEDPGRVRPGRNRANVLAPHSNVTIPAATPVSTAATAGS